MNTMILRITTQVITVLNGVIHCLLGYLLSVKELPAKNKALLSVKGLVLGVHRYVNTEEQVKVLSSSTSVITITQRVQFRSSV
ncbi:hypothetical protein Tco_0874576 [Tanacetum coccineum]|uniref:Secreted protein n=1 Tax=Tanacetum coccineum TaxID=301880 RepID=A0ABQ5BLZ7_9ASTR